MTRAFVLMMLGWLTPSVDVAAQANPGEIKHRNDCRLAEQVLVKGEPANKRAWALQLIGTCDEAPAVLVGLWTSPPTDADEIQSLYYASIHSGDPQVFDAAFAVVQNTSAPSTLRLAALGTVVTRVRPDLMLSFSERKPLEGIPPLEWNNVWGTVDHPWDEAGPPPAGAMDQVVQLVHELATNSGDSLLRDSAWWLTELYGLGG